MKKILFIDDDESITFSSAKYLTRMGYSIILANNGDHGLRLVKENSSEISLIITDVMMPIMDGIELCRTIKLDSDLKNIPVLIISSLTDISDKFIGYDAGAEDYLTKPFDLLELFLKVKAIVNRYQIISDKYEKNMMKLDLISNETHQLVEDQKNELIINEKISKETSFTLKMNKNNSSVKVSDKEIHLTSLEFYILNYLVDNSERFVSIDELLQEIMEYPPGTGNPEAIRTHIKNIRAKIENDPSSPKTIINIPKMGYKVLGSDKWN